MRDLWGVWAEFPSLCTTVAELDPVAGEVLPSCEFVGPVVESQPRSVWRPPWPPHESKPLVLVSFSTGSAWYQSSRVARALAGLDGYRFHVLVTAGTVHRSERDMAANAAVASYVPHLEILPQVGVTVSHGGYGTVVASLSQGVPMVCLPNPFSDQSAQAAQVERLGAGLALDRELATGREIAQAIATVCDGASYPRAAQRVATLISAHSGAATAASRVETLASSQREA